MGLEQKVKEAKVECKKLEHPFIGREYRVEVRTKEIIATLYYNPATGENSFSISGEYERLEGICTVPIAEIRILEADNKLLTRIEDSLWIDSIKQNLPFKIEVNGYRIKIFRYPTLSELKERLNFSPLKECIEAIESKIKQESSKETEPYSRIAQIIQQRTIEYLRRHKLLRTLFEETRIRIYLVEGNRIYPVEFYQGTTERFTAIIKKGLSFLYKLFCSLFHPRIC